MALFRKVCKAIPISYSILMGASERCPIEMLKEEVAATKKKITIQNKYTP